MTHPTSRAAAAAREAARRRDGQFGHQHRGEADGTVVAIAGESLPTRLWEGLQGRELAQKVAVQMVRERNKLIRVADAAGLAPTSQYTPDVTDGYHSRP